MPLKARSIGKIGMLVGVLIGSFFITLWLTSPNRTDDRSPLERLASSSISNRGDLVEAAIAAGMERAWRMKGNVDVIKRLNERDVTTQGWLAVPWGGDERPLTLLIFVGGKKVAATQTRGERPDVTKEFALVNGAEKNVAFDVSFFCPTGAQPVFAGISPDNEYFFLRSFTCP